MKHMLVGNVGIFEEQYVIGLLKMMIRKDGGVVWSNAYYSSLIGYINDSLLL